MAKIYKFEARQGGGVLCPPLGLAFPSLTRIAQRLSREERDALGLSADPGEPTIYYTLRDEDDAFCQYAGTIERATIQGMPDRDGPSLIIRHHPNEAHAAGYFSALVEIIDPDWEVDFHELCQTEQGLFTLTQRPNWPGFPVPIVLYLAERRANNKFGSEYWYLALAPDGSPVRLPDYEVPSSRGPGDLKRNKEPEMTATATTETTSPPALGWTYGQFLPEVGEPLLAKMRRYQALTSQAKALRKEIVAEVNQRWELPEIRLAKQLLREASIAVRGKPCRGFSTVC